MDIRNYIPATLWEDPLEALTHGEAIKVAKDLRALATHLEDTAKLDAAMNLRDNKFLSDGVVFKEVKPTTAVVLNAALVRRVYPIHEHAELYRETKRKGYIKAEVVDA